MYAFVDQPVERLHNDARFLLWAMRGWADAGERSCCQPMALSRGFASMQALPVLPDFHVAMTLLAKHAPTPPVLAPMATLCIAEDEAVLLSLWSDLARGADDRLRATLSLLVDEGVLAPIVAVMTSAMTQFQAAGLDLSGLFPENMKEPK